ncbi:MAG: DUF5671 domain-containing protein [Anaerolineales bacterium]
MRTVKRIYIYAVSLISLEVVLWGMIGLLRSIFSDQALSGGVNRLAAALSLILVGVPVFLIHWLWAQGEAAREMEERASAVRAVFLYGVLLGTLIPAAQNLLAVINRLLMPAFQVPVYRAVFGGGQRLTDNLIALCMNLLVAGYFLRTVRADWQAVTPLDSFRLARRIYRYLWVLYGLAMLVGGVQQLLHFVIEWAGKATSPTTLFMMDLRVLAANGLALALVGAPIWAAAWLTVQRSLGEIEERASLLRLGILYALSLVGVTTVLSSGALIVRLLLRLLLGEQMSAGAALGEVNAPLSVGLPIGGVWAYYGYWLSRTMKEVSEAPRRAGMRRLYFYILSAIGLVATFVGLNMLLDFSLDVPRHTLAWQHSLRLQLATALAILAAGLPLWLSTWLPMQAEALAAGETGDHARRSLTRRIYLYLVLFASVIGMMASAGVLTFTLLQILLGSPPEDRLLLLDSLRTLFWFVLVGIYHIAVLRADGRRAASALAEKHAAFPVLVFDSGEGVFAAAVRSAIHKTAPGLAVAVQMAGQPIPPQTAPRAVILPADLALDSPAALRQWLESYAGSRIVVPRPAPGWVWAGSSRESAALAQAALAVRQLAEGQDVRLTTGNPAAMVVVYILAGIGALPVLGLFISLALSLVVR